jgi:hypothetical protein
MQLQFRHTLAATPAELSSDGWVRHPLALPYPTATHIILHNILQIYTLYAACMHACMMCNARSPGLISGGMQRQPRSILVLSWCMHTARLRPATCKVHATRYMQGHVRTSACTRHHTRRHTRRRYRVMQPRTTLLPSHYLVDYLVGLRPAFNAYFRTCHTRSMP